MGGSKWREKCLLSNSCGAACACAHPGMRLPARALPNRRPVSQKKKSSNSETMLTTVISILLLCLVSPSTAQVDLSTCGDEDSVVTCSFFFGKLDEALSTGRRLVYASQGVLPARR